MFSEVLETERYKNISLYRWPVRNSCNRICQSSCQHCQGFFSKMRFYDKRREVFVASQKELPWLGIKIVLTKGLFAISENRTTSILIAIKIIKELTYSTARKLSRKIFGKIISTKFVLGNITQFFLFLINLYLLSDKKIKFTKVNYNCEIQKLYLHILYIKLKSQKQKKRKTVSCERIKSEVAIMWFMYLFVNIDHSHKERIATKPCDYV